MSPNRIFLYHTAMGEGRNGPPETRSSQDSNLFAVRTKFCFCYEYLETLRVSGHTEVMRVPFYSVPKNNEPHLRKTGDTKRATEPGTTTRRDSSESDEASTRQEDRNLKPSWTFLYGDVQPFSQKVCSPPTLEKKTNLELLWQKKLSYINLTTSYYI